jgi:HEAT repeat protein
VRALDILDQTSSGRRLLPILGHLPEAADARLAAKATLFVGRRVMNPAWSAKLLARPEDRIRANAVETLWGLKTPPALDLLERCATDRNNRVMGNALIGLHIAGRPEVDAGVVSLARNGDPGRRSTAAWVMGRLANDRWVDTLSGMMRDDAPAVRSTALRSLMEIRRHDPVVIGSVASEDTEGAVDPQSQILEAASSAVSEPDSPEPQIPELRLPEIRLDGSSFRARPRFRSAS